MVIHSYNIDDLFIELPPYREMLVSYPTDCAYDEPPIYLGKIQTLSVTITLRTSLKDVRGHSNRTSGDIPTGCPAMFYFCIFT